MHRSLLVARGHSVGRPGARRGFTLVDVTVAAAILAIGASAMAATIVTSMTLNRVNQETAVAQQAARRMLERVRAVPFREAFAACNASAADDAGLSAAALGADFVVNELKACDGDADGRCGRIVFPLDGGGSGELREDAFDPGLGLPRDLNLDGAIDALDHSADYALLPVRIRVEWQGANGPRSFQVETMLCTR